MEVVQVTFDLEVPNHLNDGLLEEIKALIESRGYTVLGSDRTTMTQEYKEKCGWVQKEEIDMFELRDIIKAYFKQFTSYENVQIDEIELLKDSYGVGFSDDCTKYRYHTIPHKTLEDFMNKRNSK